jgi:hypothetical protein
VVGILGLVLMLCFVLPSGCSKSPETPKGKLEKLQGLEEYKGWKIYSYDRVKILYPENHPQEPYFKSICEGYERSANAIAGRLGMPPFKDTLYIVFYSGFGQGRELSNHHWPYVEDEVIYFWRPSYVGVTLADFMARRWSKTWPSRDIFHHGLRTFFDFSGQNYHARTEQLIDSNMFVPLESLAVSQEFVSDSERVYSAEAASLVAYILAADGPAKFKRLYEATGPFDSIVPAILGVSVDSLQSGWLDFMRRNLPADTTGK